jgi:ribokinase
VKYPRTVRVAVVGHVEWVDFVEIDRLPREGEVLHARDAFTRAAGGGGVAAVVLAELGAEVDFFCALGQDADGQAAAQQLTERGVRVHAAWRQQPTRRAITLLEGGERTIVTIGDRLEPLASDPLGWDILDEARGVYFTAGDAGAFGQARRAGVLVATPRARDALSGAGALTPSGDPPDRPIDALVYSAHDPEEAEWAKRLADRARLMMETMGHDGGTWFGAEQGSWPAVPPPGPPRDAYGCGDSFAAGFTFGLAEGRSVADAAAIGAERGARCLARVGAP